MYLEDFNYSLPKNLIAKRPTYKRESKILICKKKKIINFKNIFNELDKDDVLIFNNTKVLPSVIDAAGCRRRASRRPTCPPLYSAHPQERGPRAPPKAQPPINAQAQVLRTPSNAVWREAAHAVHRRGKQTRSVNSQVAGQGERPSKRRSTVC